MNNAGQTLAALRTLARRQQIIVLALAGGVVLFLAVAVYLRTVDGFAADEALDPALPLAGLAVAVGSVVASFLVPRSIDRQARAQVARNTAPGSAGEPGDVDAYGQAFITRSILGAAIVEGAGFLNGVAYLLTGNALSIAVAVVLAAIVAARATTPARLADWIEAQRRLAGEESLLGR